MKELFIGKISKILDYDLYTIEVDIPGYNEALPAFPKRGEVDEPRAGDVVLLTELDPLYKSYYLWEKLKENNFIGIRARGKVLRMSEEEISLGVFDSSDESWYDKNDGIDHTPTPTSWIKVDKDGNIDIKAEGNQNVTISGDCNITVNGNTKIESSGSCDIKASGGCTIDSPNVKITGGILETSGSCIPTGTGGYCGISTCLFSGAPHVGDKISNT